LQDFLWLVFPHGAARLDESLIQIDEHVEKGEPAVVRVSRRIVAHLKDFTRHNSMRIQSLYRRMYKVAGPKVVRII
jgi:hypothetical protein